MDGGGGVIGGTSGPAADSDAARRTIRNVCPHDAHWTIPSPPAGTWSGWPHFGH